MQVRPLKTLNYAGSSLRRWRWWERAIASADCLFRQPIFTVAILAREQQNGPFAIRAAEDGRCDPICLLISSHRVASHRIASHRIAPREQEREVRAGSTAKATATAAGRGHIR